MQKITSVYLFLNDIGGSEVLLILLFILIFFGSKSIPGIARTVGRTMRQIKDATSDIQSEITKSAGEYKKDLNLDGIFKETSEELKVPLDQMVDEIEHTVRYGKPKSTSNTENTKEQRKVDEGNGANFKETVTPKEITPSETKKPASKDKDSK